MLGVGGWWVRAEGLEVGSRMLIWIWIAQSFVSLRFKTVASWCVVASRLSSSCTQKRITKAELSVLWSATSVVQTSGEEASPSHEQHTQLRTLQRYDTCTRLPSQRSPCCRSPSLMGEASKTQQRLTKTDSRQKNRDNCRSVLTEESYIQGVRATLHSSPSCKNPCKADCTHDAQTNTA